MKPLIRTIAGVALAPLLFSASVAAAATLHVPADYATIQAAIDAASPGDIIEVTPPAPNTFYHEHLTINKSLDLRGSNYGVDPRHVENRGNETVIDGDNSGDVITVTASNVKIDGFIISHRLDENVGTSGNGITLSTSVSNITITNNIVVENTIGVFANCGGTTLIKHNRFQDNSRLDFITSFDAYGIWADHTTDLTIEENEFHNHGDREVIRLASGSHSNPVLKCNEIHDNLRVVTVVSASNATIQGNTFNQNGSGDIGTSLALGSNSSNVAVSNNIFTNNTRGVSVGGSSMSSVTVNNNFFANNSDFAAAVFSYSGALDVTNNWWDSASGPVFSGTNKLFIDSGQSATSSPFLTVGTDSDPGSCGFQPTTTLPAISINDVSVTEGDGGTTTATFTVSLSEASAQTVSVDYATANGTAVAPGDYTAIPTTTLTFTPGQTSKPVAVTVNADLLDEPDETFTVDLGNPTNATIADASGLGTIVDDDAAPTLAIDDVTVGEGGGTATFTVSLSAASGKTVSVSLSTANGTAVAPDDYTAIVNTLLTFDPGQTTKLVPVTIVQDVLNEADETFSVNLSNATNATIADGTGLGTIIDDDPAPSLAINDVTVGEGGGTATFTVSLSAASGKTVTVDYATANGSAVAPGDYTAIPTTALTFAPGVTTQPVAVTINQDALNEANETFTVNLSNPTNATIADASGLGTIVDDDAAPTLAIDDVTVGEGGGTATFTVSLSAASAQTVSVTLSTANGTAVAPDDYTAIVNTLLTFDPGQTTKLVPVTIVQDVLNEADETFSVNLSNATNATIADASGLGTIVDDDAAPSLSINDVTVGEGGGTATFTVSLSAASGKTVTVDYATANGTAVAPGDYTAIPTTALTFAPGVTTQPVAVTINQDALNEANETFTVDLSNAANATIGTGTGTGTIVDDDAEPSLAIDNVSVTEGNSGATTATFTVTLSAASGKTVTVDYATANGTAVAPGDYTAIPTTTLTFAPGVTTQPVAVSVNGDLLNEGNETFTVNLSSASNATIGTGTGTGTIIDDDGAPALSINDVSVTEGNSGATTATFTVTLSAASGQTVTVDYATANGTAVAPGDYDAIPTTTLTFDPGQTSKPVAVTVNGDLLNEGNETLTVGLSNATNATIARATGTGTIVDDDPEPSLAIDNVSVGEGGGTATLTVTLSAASGKTVTVDYATANGAAVAPGDYVAIPTTTLTFAPGVTTQPVAVTINQDALDEPDETFTVNLSNASNATLGTGTGTGTIVDDDPEPSLVIDNVSVAEGNSGATTATFTVTLSAASGKTVTVDYATANGTAVAPGDYTAIPTTTLTFAPGVTTQPVAVTVNGDLLNEGNETFTVNLSNAANATIGTATGTGTIVDDDGAPSLSINDVSVTEGDGGTTTAMFTVTLSAASGQTVTVDYATANGTAVAPADYVAIPTTTLTFTPGQTSKPVAVTVNGDLLDEDDETFTVNLNNATNATIADASGLGTIVDDDAAPSIAINDVSVGEGGGSAAFTVSLSAASGKTVTVDYVTANGTAVAPDDYTAISTTTLTFAPGATTQPVVVTIAQDALDEVDETFAVNLSNATNATIADASGLGTIVDDDPAPSLTINDVSVTEGNSGTTTATFTVTLSAASGTTVTVSYATANGSAVAPGDYTAIPTTTLTFTPGVTTQPVAVSVNGDVLAESDETFFVNLGSPTNATIADAQGVGTILNDDGAPDVVAGTPAPGTCVSTVVPCATVPVTIARTDATPMRAFSVTFTLSSQLQLCSGTSSITEGTYLNSVGSTVFLVTDLGGGSYKADCSITGLPCGPTGASGTLFNIGVMNSGADGTGTISVGAVILRDCSNLPIAGSAGAPASILIDRTPPVAVANAAAVQVKSGNDTDGTTKVNVAYSTPGDATVIEVWRKGFGSYPEYDNAGGAAPTAPAYPPSGAGWTLVPDATATGVADETTARDFYYYVVFTKDACGNVSLVSNLTNGTLNYFLGDVSTGVATCVGENKVNTADVSYLGSHYGATLGPASPLACLDVGPTMDGTVDGRPATDNVLDFEDLMIFALDYGTVSSPSLVASVATLATNDAARDELSFEAPDHVDAAQVIAVPVRLRGAGNVQGMSIPLSWDAAVVEPVTTESGGFVEAQSGVMLSPKAGTVDVALLGARSHGLSGEGVIAVVTFRAKTAGDPRFGVATVRARDASNRSITLGASRTATQADLPKVTELLPVAPNPSRGNALFAFSLAGVAPVDLTVFSVDGRRVRTVAHGVHEAGNYRLNWDGKDEQGNAVSSGVFYVRLEAGGKRFTRTLVRMR